MLSALVPLALTAHVSPARAVAGAFMTLTVVPVMQAMAVAFWGRPAALAVGVLVAALTVALVVGPPPEVALPDTRWRVALDDPAIVAHVTLAPPVRSRATQVLTGGGTARLLVCLARGEGADVETKLNGVALRVSESPGGDCWNRYDVPGSILTGSLSAAEVMLAGRRPGAAELVGGYSRRRPSGGGPGGAALLVAGRVEKVDLSPTAPGVQSGRYFVELRIFDADGRLVEIWF